MTEGLPHVALRGHEQIAASLCDAGLDAKPIDGWVYVALPGERLLYIGAEYGQSLDATVYDSIPAWFKDAALDTGGSAASSQSESS